MLRIAWRNLWRNRARTLILLTAIGGSYALSLVSMGMGDDMHSKMAVKAGEAAGGHVLLQAEGYLEDRDVSRVLEVSPELLVALREAPGVREAAVRIDISGLLSTSETSAPTAILGVEPERQRLLGDPAGKLVSGAFPAPGEGGPMGHPIALGQGLARDLEVSLGDRVVLTCTKVDGEVGRALFLVSGTLKTGSKELDQTLAYTNLKGARAALGMGPQQAHQVGLVGDDHMRSDGLLKQIEPTLLAHPTSGRVAWTWQRAMPELVGFIEIDDAFNYLFLVVLFVIVAFAIANSFLMVVMERVREFGLLSALGMTGPRIAGMLMLETSMLTAVAVAGGLALGLAGHGALSHFGVDLAQVYGMELELAGVSLSDLILRSELRPEKWLSATGLVASLVLSSGMYPAWRASRMAPAQAMRFYE